MFHDVIGVVGHFFHDAEGSCVESKGKTSAVGKGSSWWTLKVRERGGQVDFHLTLCVFVVL